MDLYEAREIVVAAEEEITRIIHRTEERTGLRFVSFSPEFTQEIQERFPKLREVFMAFEV